MNRVIILVCVLLTIVIASSLLKISREDFQCMTDKVTDIFDWRTFIGVWAPKQNPAYYKLRTDGTFNSPQGTPLPLKGRDQLLNNPEGPPVNGLEGAPRALSVFAFNHSSPLCCYGPNGGFSTSSGCVCVTPEQQRWFSSVGNNRKAGYVGID
jgi:hypothetical protein